jgi:hypothetical protein
VDFKTESGEVEYKFNIDNSAGFDLLVSDIEFLEITNGDPAADLPGTCNMQFSSSKTLCLCE